MKVNASLDNQNWRSPVMQNYNSGGMDKANRFKEDRKNNLALRGEMSLGGGQYPGMTRNPTAGLLSNPKENFGAYKPPQNIKYGSNQLDQPVTHEELMKARSSLQLLKSKNRTFNTASTNNLHKQGEEMDWAKSANNFGNKMNGGNLKNNNNQRLKNYEDEDDDYKYNNDNREFAPGPRNLGPDQDTTSLYQGKNNHYRKVFKPAVKGNQNPHFMDAEDNQTYDHITWNINRELGDIDAKLQKKNQILSGSNNRMPVKSDFGSSQQSSQNGGGFNNPNSRLKNVKKPNNFSQQSTSSSENGYFPSNENSMSQQPTKPNLKPSLKQKMSYQITKQKPKQDNDFDMNDYGFKDNRSKYNQYQHFEQQPEEQAPMTYKPQPKKPSKPVNNYEDEEPAPKNTKIYSKPKIGVRSSKDKVNLKQIDEERNDPNSFKQNQPLNNSKVTFNMNVQDDEYGGGGDEELIECPQGCGRKFNANAIEKHAKICVKVFQKKRKQFNSDEQRAVDGLDEVPVQRSNKYKASKGKNNNSSKGGPSAEGKAKWKKQSEAFRAAMKAARGSQLSQEDQQALNGGQKDDRVQCPTCGRKFDEIAAERHFPICKAKNKGKMGFKK